MLDLIYENSFWGISNWLFNIIIVSAASIAGIIIKFFIVRLTRYYRSKSKFSFLKSIVLHLGRPLNIFLPLVFLSITKVLIILPPTLLSIYHKVIEIGLILAFSYILISFLKVLQDFVFSTYDLSKEDNLRERKIRTQLEFLQKLFIAVIILLTIAAVLFSFDGMRKIGAGLLTGVGIGGIIIGFAAQKSLGNLLVGFQIAFTQPIRIDDVLIVEGEWGKVEDITLTYVVVHIWDHRRLILPITYFIETPFQNWTRNSAEIIGTVYLYVDYSLPLDSLRTEFVKLLEKSPLWDKKVQVIQVTDSKQSVMEVRALMSSRNSSDAFDLRCYIREGLINFIQNNFPDSLPQTRANIIHTSADNHQKVI